MNDPEQTVRLELRETLSQKIGVKSKRPALVFLQGQTIGQTIHLSKEQVVIGRGSNADIMVMDEVASRLHAEIQRLDAADGCAEYYINDLGSTNGTYLNGTRISEVRLLEDGDKIKIGKHLMKFALLDDFEAEFQEKVHQMTLRDELTGLRSRRSLFADLDHLVTQASRSLSPPPITVLMMDLDFFKKVNDGKGHLVGSQTIRDVGHIIREVVGSSDMAARYGGEEYLAYLFGTRDDGVEVAERIRKAVEAHTFAGSAIDPTQTMRVTISLGTATFPADGLSALELVQKADQALYRAKQSGRNQTCIYDPHLDQPDALRQAIDASAILYGPADAQ